MAEVDRKVSEGTTVEVGIIPKSIPCAAPVES